MFKAPLVWLAVLSLFLVGCAKTSAESVVNADGSWTRTLKLTVGKEMGEEKWMDIFAMPAGAEWKKFEEIKDDEKVTTLTRSFPVGNDAITDIIVREKETTKLKNYVVVRRLESGKLEYYEKIVFLAGDADKKKQDFDVYIKDLKAAMPEGKATDEDYQVLAKKTLTSITRMMFGPDDHLMGSLILNPDGAARRLRIKIAQQQDKLLAEQFGDRLSKEERAQVISKLLSQFDSKKLVEKNKPNESDPSQSSANMVGMSVAVKLPGKILETNGEIDPITGEVFWDFASASAEVDVLELRAICQP